LRVIGEECEAHLLVEQLRPQAVHHRHVTREVGPHERSRDLRLREKLGQQDAAVDDIDRRAFRAEAPAAVREVLRRADQRLHAVLGEGALEHLELGQRGQAGPVDDGDAAHLPTVRAAHRRELLARGAEGTRAIPLAERTHRRESLEDPHEHVVVRHPCRRFGVVFDVADDALGHEAVEPRRRRRGREAGIREREAVLLWR
jgi:hypothetical protein